MCKYVEFHNLDFSCLSRREIVKVKDVIKDTIWQPGSLYGLSPAPAVSVLLPTYRRARNGFFRRAVESILAQTLKDLELIIIDDASTDGTAQQIEEFMQRDGRVSRLTHPRNVGLPAISEYEGFLKTRADYLAFAFDDDLFYPQALGKLLEHSRSNPDKLCYGHVAMRVVEKWSALEQSIKLGYDVSAHNIRSWNCISNNAVLMPRHILEDIGLYDPHVVLSRLCDWDLWRRVSEKHLLKYVGTPVGEVAGPATKDSIGKTYALDQWAVEEWMRTNRNHKLRPDSFCEYEIFGAAPTHTRNTQTACLELSQHHLRNRPWLENGPSEDRGDGQILVANTTYDASTTIYFDFLPEKIRSRVRIFQYRSDQDIAELGRASCLIIVRHLDPLQDLIDAAFALEIPCYYFADDNFTLLQSKEESALGEDYSLDALKRKLKNFTGVFLSASALREYFEKHRIHQNLLLLPPCFADMEPVVNPPPAPVQERPLTLAFIGGRHRRLRLRSCVLPAIEALTNKGATIHLVLGGADEELSRDMERFRSQRLKISCEPFEIDWKRSLLKIADYRPHILVHAPSDSINNGYKTLNVAACAWLLNAVLLAPCHPPYDKFNGKENAVLAAKPFQSKSWLHALEELSRNVAGWDEILRNNSEFCRKEFSGTVNESALCDILKKAPPVDMTILENRLKDLVRMRETSTHIGMAAVSTRDLQLNLKELARIRSRRKNSRLVRFFKGDDDLWPVVAPVFEDIKLFMDEQGIYRRKRQLELTDALHDRDLEFTMHFPPGVLKSISAVFSTDGVQKGRIGLELLNGNGGSIIRATRDLSKTDLHSPVEFDMNDTEIGAHTDLNIRLFALSSWPVYSFELVQYGFHRISRKSIAPFLKLNYR